MKKKTQDPSKRAPRVRRALELENFEIERCEDRFALSASLPGDLLLHALSVDSPYDSIDPSSDLSQPAESLQPASTDPSPNLFDQAATVRELASQVGSHPLDGSGQTIAVIDSGVAWDHVALGGGFGPGYRVVGGWDFAENDAIPYDDGPAGFHGTHVAGIVAGKSDAFTGVAPNADIVALRVFDDSGMGELPWIEASLRWVHEHQNDFASPITTVNLSVGAALNADNLAEAQNILEDELALLREDNILVFAAAGNFFGNTVTDESLMYPASSESVVAVGSITNSGSLSPFSQRADGILAADGESIRSSVPDHVYGWDGHVDDFASLDGTSMATPQIAAASMLVRQSMLDQGLHPSADDVLIRLQESMQTQVDPETGAHYHVVDLHSAILPQSEDWQSGSEPDVDADNSTPVLSEPTPVLSEPTLTQFIGDNQNEAYVLDLRDGIELRSGGNVYRFDSDASADSALIIDVGGGADSLHILGSSDAERLIMHPRSLAAAKSVLSTNTYKIELRGVEAVLFDGGGGSDRATLYDSDDDDILRSQPNMATLSGVGFQFQVNQIPRIYVHATAGGSDQAFLSDSDGDDTLAVQPQFTSLRGNDTFQAAYGFEKVHAYSSAGGHDRASIYDSDGDDTMNVSPNRSIITGPSYQVSARGFESVEAFASNGGTDTANIYTDEIDSRWDRAPDRLQWTGEDGVVRIARNFERMQAFEQYEPIAIQTQSLGGQLQQSILEDPAERLRRERLASQSVFEWLGEQP
ncbi:Subtilisin E precursor [Planctomycetes bacterium CA13]|uniref:Subtilisin E n=1 Tax=Novipirellula herctigrandis TaxID=2527986 RepID=A0A5C5YZQ2_9BACT|nr:Subtilisin E precursor [Planctomycetes bacterium CA13]